MLRVRPMTRSDYDAVAAIFAEGIAAGLATFGEWRDVVLLELRL